MHWEPQGQDITNNSFGCPHHCADLVQHCGVCSLCVRANFLNHQYTPAISLPIRIIAQLNLFNDTMHEEHLVIKTFHLLGGSNWTEFLLAWVDLYGTDSLNSTAGTLTTSLAFLVIIALILLKLF